MPITLTAVARAVGGLAVLACVVAIGLARLEPEGAHFRMLTPPPYEVIDGFRVSADRHDPRFLDLHTGTLREFRLAPGEGFDFASCSPWVNEQGEYQVIGRWEHRDASRSGTYRFEEFGVARFAMPSGRLIEKFPVEVVPASRPCWFPGAKSKVLYGGGDGQLYQLDFTADGDDGSRSARPEPRLITWGCDRPGEGLTLHDPVWSNDPRLRGRLIVSLTYLQNHGDSRLTPAHLWWLDLDDKGTRVVAAGPLNPEDRGQVPPDSAGEVRHPNLATTADGALTLAYLWQPRQGHGRWELRLAPVSADPRTGEPVCRPSEAQTLTTEHLGVIASFSPDGRYVYGLVGAGAGGAPGAQVMRFPVTPGTTPAPGTAVAAIGVRALPKS